MRLLTTLLVIPVLSVFAIACDGGDDEEDITPTAAATTAAPTQDAESPTTEPTDTPEAEETETPEPSDETPEPTDGTVFPQNPGSTDAFSMKPLPDPAQGIYTLTDVRVGAHPESGGWDRIVFEFEDVEGFPGAHPGGTVEYVDDAAQCGSGNPVSVEGDAIMSITFDMTQAHDDNGNLTIDDTEIDGPGNSILEAVSYCDFEGLVQWAIGVPDEQNFKVTFLADPARVVVDVKWP